MTLVRRENKKSTSPKHPSPADIGSKFLVRYKFFGFVLLCFCLFYTLDMESKWNTKQLHFNRGKEENYQETQIR